MKTLVKVFTLIIFSVSLYSQSSGVISYQEVIKLKLEMDGMPEGVDLSGMLPTSRTLDKVLKFDGHLSLYVDGENEEENTELESDDGTFKMVLMTSDIESKLFIDNKSRESVQQEGFMNKSFVISDEVPQYKWRITSEKVKYLDFECIKATTTNEENEEIVAWFAPSIRASVGPSDYGQLPGAILLLSVNGEDHEIKATKVELTEIDKIKRPNDGKKVTKEEYDKIIDEKMKEMTKNYGGKGISIRG